MEDVAEVPLFMSRLDTSVPDDVPVRVGDCECAGHPHDALDGHDDGDIVWLKPSLDLPLGLAVTAAQRKAFGDPVLLEQQIGQAYIAYGITRWNFLDDDGKPIELNPTNAIRALPWDKGGALVADKADDLYSEALIRPLLEKARQLSERGRTASSTSPTRKTSTGTRKRSKSSSALALAGTPG